MNTPLVESPSRVLSGAHIDAAKYEEMYRQSIQDPEAFFGAAAREFITWVSEPTKVVSYDFSLIGKSSKPYVQWFPDGTLNASVQCLDRHLKDRGEQVSLIWQSDDGKEERKITFQELHAEACKIGSVLRSRGVKKGDRVTIYMGMTPEVVMTMLACARIGAIHSVCFSAFAPEELRKRVDHAEAKAVVTCDVSYHGGKEVGLKNNVDKALEGCKSVETVLVYQRSRGDTLSCSMTEKRDISWSDTVGTAPAECEPEVMNAEDPLFILYTSGSTGQPKGVIHSTAGYMLHTQMTFKYTFDYREGDVFWCTADVGWITGHSYLTYGPLACGATQIMTEGVPTFPSPKRWWELIEKHKVTQFYTAPTAIRSLAALGEEHLASSDLSSLRVLGTVGEPIDEKAWHWYFSEVGKNQCAIVDTWWQTETGGHMITTLPGAHGMKPAHAGKPFFGIDAAILDENGKECAVGEKGKLVIKSPWPSMLRGCWGDPKSERVAEVYFPNDSPYYVVGDAAILDDDGFYRIVGRIDDVIIVSGHNIGSGELEEAINANDSVASSAVVGIPDETTGNSITAFVVLIEDAPQEGIYESVRQTVQESIGPHAKPKAVIVVSALPSTRSGKVMRRILRHFATGGSMEDVGDTSTLLNPEAVQAVANALMN